LTHSFCPVWQHSFSLHCQPYRKGFGTNVETLYLENPPRWFSEFIRCCRRVSERWKTTTFTQGCTRCSPAEIRAEKWLWMFTYLFDWLIHWCVYLPHTEKKS
jgi:hypothetical protein